MSSQSISSRSHATLKVLTLLSFGVLYHRNRNLVPKLEKFEPILDATLPSYCIYKSQRKSLYLFLPGQTFIAITTTSLSPMSCLHR